jgi:predicted RNase H-related nuclease YkuK (DUF458 family)
VNGLLFTSPTRGKLDFDSMFEDILLYLREDPEAPHKLIIGSDSQLRDDLVFVTAVIVHRVGKGARFYYQKHHHRRMATLRQRIFYETSLSLGLASRVASRLSERGVDGCNVEIHIDIGPNGDTRDLIREIVGMVTGSGFDAKIKPESYGASKVADKFTK